MPGYQLSRSGARRDNLAALQELVEDVKILGMGHQRVKCDRFGDGCQIAHKCSFSLLGAGKHCRASGPQAGIPIVNFEPFRACAVGHSPGGCL